MFAAQEVTVEVPFEVATRRLTHLINRGGLHTPSQTAYLTGLASEWRVGPFGDIPGMSKLVRVRWLEPIRRGFTTSVPLRWEATGPAGGVFPVLDADLIVAKHGEDQTSVGLTGCYRPPLGWIGQTLDRAFMHRVATATMQSLLGAIADGIRDLSEQLDRDGQPGCCRPLVGAQDA